MIIAGEASGDLYGAELIKRIKQSLDVEIIATGGRLMKKTGVEIKFDITDLATIGITEVFKKIPNFFIVYQRIKSYIKNNRPDLLILIDFPELNMRIAKAVKALHIPIIYYIPPAIWAWRKGRAKQIANNTNKVISVFPFEAEIYKANGADVTLLKHPLLEIAKPHMSKEAAYAQFCLDNTKLIIGLLPGSRLHEVKILLPILLTAGKYIHQKFTDVQFILPLATTLNYADIKHCFEGLTYTIKIIPNNVYDVMNICNFLILASGTATLEAACLSVPMIIIYKLSRVTFLLGKLLINCQFIGLPNIIANRLIVKELLQAEAEPKKLAAEVINILTDEYKIEKMKEELKEVVNNLNTGEDMNCFIKLIHNYLY